MQRMKETKLEQRIIETLDKATTQISEILSYGQLDTKDTDALCDIQQILLDALATRQTTQDLFDRFARQHKGKTLYQMYSDPVPCGASAFYDIHTKQPFFAQVKEKSTAVNYT